MFCPHPVPPLVSPSNSLGLSRWKILFYTAPVLSDARTTRITAGYEPRLSLYRILRKGGGARAKYNDVQSQVLHGRAEEHAAVGRRACGRSLVRLWVIPVEDGFRRQHGDIPGKIFPRLSWERLVNLYRQMVFTFNTPLSTKENHNERLGLIDRISNIARTQVRAFQYSQRAQIYLV